MGCVSLSTAKRWSGRQAWAGSIRERLAVSRIPRWGVPAYGSGRGRALIDRELYIPKDWTSDRERCQSVGIGDDIEFTTKPDLGLRMLKRAVKSGIPFEWVTADEVYGQTSRIRVWLEEYDVPHVLAVAKSQMVMTMEFFGQARAHELIGELPDDAWVRLSCGNGAHGPRTYDWTAAAIRPWRRDGWDHWLLARRSAADPTDIAYYICFCPSETPLEELAQVAGSRWMVEECFQTAKTKPDSTAIRSATTPLGTGT